MPMVLEELTETANQPESFSFPKKKIGKKTVVERSCQPQWFKTWSWLHYNEAEDSVHCHLCLKALKFKHLTLSSGSDPAFVSLPFKYLISFFYVYDKKLFNLAS